MLGRRKLILMSPGATFTVSRLNCWNCHFMGHVWDTSKLQNVTLGKHVEDKSDTSPALSALSSPSLLGIRCCLHSVGPEQSGNCILALISLHLLSTKIWGIWFNSFQIWTQGDQFKALQSRILNMKVQFFSLLGKHWLVGSAVPNLLFILLMGLVQRVSLIVLFPWES